MFDNGGMCGGYPAPTCQKHRAVRNTNIHELAEKQAPLAHAHRHQPASLRTRSALQGEHVTVEGPYITAPHKSGDIFTHSYNGGGGYGDVLERDPIKTAMDVENGYLTTQAADEVFGIVLKEDEDGYPVADIEATVKRPRRDARQAARQGNAGVGVDRRERGRVEKADFAPEVKKMYASAIKLSSRFTREFSDFWNVDAKSIFMPGAKP